MAEHDFDSLPLAFIRELSDDNTIGNRSYRCSSRLWDVDALVQGGIFAFMSIIDRPLFIFMFCSKSAIEALLSKVIRSLLESLMNCFLYAAARLNKNEIPRPDGRGLRGIA